MTLAVHPSRWRVLAVLGLTQFVILVDTTIVNVALPSIQREFASTTSGLSWVVNGYMLMAGGLLLVGGRAADLFGRRRMFLLGVWLFGVASLVCGLAPNMEVLVIGRFAQGAGQALVSPAAISLVTLMFADARERAKAYAIWGSLAGFGAITGVVLSGLLIELTDWRLTFLINPVVVALPLLLVPRYVPAEDRSARGRVDLMGAALVTSGVLALIYGLLGASHGSWTAPGVYVPVGLGVLLIAAFVVWLLRSADPLVPPRFFRNRVRISGNIATVFIVSTTEVFLFLATLYLQDLRGYSALEAGLAYVPLCLVIFPAIFISSRMIVRIGPLPTTVIGFAFYAGAMLMFSWVPLDGSYLTDILPPMILFAIGTGITNPSLPSLVLRDVSEENAGTAAGVASTVGQLSGSIGLAVFVTLAVLHQSGLADAGTARAAAQLGGYQFAFVISAVTCVVGAAIVALLGWHSRPSRMPPRREVP